MQRAAPSTAQARTHLACVSLDHGGGDLRCGQKQQEGEEVGAERHDQGTHAHCPQLLRADAPHDGCTHAHGRVKRNTPRGACMRVCSHTCMCSTKRARNGIPRARTYQHIVQGAHAEHRHERVCALACGAALVS